ncbi:MAG: hypothetical protein HZA22_03190 [Nitrospirae bacterium]|nr:hypothetical protein [Nitrospirota bacterium]
MKGEIVIMQVESASLREEIAAHYKKHCGSCTGACCNLELEEGFLAFGWELDGLQKAGRLPGADGPSCARLVPFNKGNWCPLAGSDYCSLHLDDRPLDCLTYPVYPEVAVCDDAPPKLTGLVFRKGCGKLDAIAADTKLLRLIQSFWEDQMTRMSGDEIREWLGEMAK